MVDFCYTLGFLKVTGRWKKQTDYVTRFLREDKSYITDCMGIEWDGAEQAQLWCYLTEGSDVKI